MEHWGPLLLGVAQLLLTVGVLAVASGRWGGNVEARLGDQPQAPKTNGEPSLGEVSRRVSVLEGALVGQKVCEAKHRAIDVELKGLHEADSAISHRLDAMED
jgi:hypothetical protein